LCDKNPKDSSYEGIENYYKNLKTTKAHLKSDKKPIKAIIMYIINGLTL